MYNLYIVKNETGNYETGDIIVGKVSEIFKGRVLTTKDDLIEEKHLTKVILGSDQNV